jgi:hypothetical protein
VTQLAPKTNLSTVDRVIDWSAPLGDDYILSSLFVVTSGTITLTNPLFAYQQTEITIAGGAVGETATITNTITTAGEQTLDGTFTIYVEAALGPYGASTTTKGDVVEMAFEEMALAGYEFDHGPDEIASALRKLDALMAESSMPAVGYNAPAGIGQSDVLDASGLPDSCVQTISIMLGCRYSPAYGKTMSAQTRKDRNEGLNAMRTLVLTIPQAQLRAGTPVGSGNKWRSIWRPFVMRGDSATVFVSG